MKQKERKEIVKIAKQFVSGFKTKFPAINGTGWLIVDPLSGYLNVVGYENTLDQLPPNETHGLVLVIVFKDGSRLIPAGGDLKGINPKAENYMWV